MTGVQTCALPISDRVEYLSRLNERYEAWIANYNSGKLLKINVDDIDFVEKKSDYNKVLEIIKKEI